MTNFNFLKSDPQFATFADTAIQAELVLPISPAFTATGSRTALEFAVKWLYSVDNALERPYDDKLVTLINTEDFKDLLPIGLMPKIEYIRWATMQLTAQRRLLLTERGCRWRICTAL